jgi:Protein required for attachment to host cells
VLVDRGSLRAYRVNETRTRGPSLQLVHDFEMTGSERELPFNVGSSRRHVSLTSDWPALETETNRRISKQLAEQIATVMKTERPEGWSFAAEPAIHKEIVDLLPRAVRERIVEHVPSDLVKIKPVKLQSHFRSLQPIRSTAIPGSLARSRRAPRRQTRVKAAAKH